MAEIANNEFCFPAGGMALEATLFCGQTFSWELAPQGGFYGVAGSRLIHARQQGDEICLLAPDGPLCPEDRDFWRSYFDLETDYAQLTGTFCQDEQLRICVAQTRGLRVLRQPFFDTLLTFILSQNNHIPRITGIAKRLREHFGPALPQGQFGFPAPARLAAAEVEDLAVLRAGFRAKYLLDAARKVASGEVSEAALRSLGTDDARSLLMRIQGVGPKVADCVLLYGLGRQEVVPMDVWMKRAMATLFPGGMPACAREKAGIAQQHIFCWARDHLPRGG